MQPYDLPDQFGHFGQFGGTFVAETLIEALDELARHVCQVQRRPRVPC